MKIKGIEIHNTFAEAFNMKAARIIVTADNNKWAKNACLSFTGFATSVIACGIEAGIEKKLVVSDAFSPTGLDLVSPSRPRREGKGRGVRKAQPHPVPSAGWLSAGTQGADQR